ncbi:MAG TPA: oxidoreductase [Spirochaetaceae bacterium]|jgi:predicted dehydrogenase|nr:oxidoreductase [Spirochaetaceae bacterium]
MSLNPIITMLGRRLRLAVIGGGEGSFIGPIHRLAARFDDRYELVTGVMSSKPDKALAYGRAMGFVPDRLYGTVAELLEKERARADGVDVVAIMTPNDSHYAYAMAAIAAGFDVICDKPMTNTLEEAEALHRAVLDSGLVFCLTHNYTGYPMVRQAKAMVEAGLLGELRLLQVEYVQGGRAGDGSPGGGSGASTKVEPINFTKPRMWKYDPARSGPSLVMGDIGTHAHNLLRFVTGLEVAELAAERGASVPGRSVDDYAGALLRMDNDARGSFWVTQAAAGVENSLRLRVSGSKGSLEWQQETPQRLDYKPLGAPAEKRTPRGSGTLPLALRSSRIVAGHPEGFPTSFANLYADAAEAIAARRAGAAPDPLALYFPNSFDGLKGMQFVAAVVESSEGDGRWVRCP